MDTNNETSTKTFELIDIPNATSYIADHARDPTSLLHPATEEMSAEALRLRLMNNRGAELPRKLHNKPSSGKSNNLYKSQR